MKKIEALALAIARQYDILEPGSEAFITMNPGLLRSFSPDRLDVVNENGIRVFGTLQGGLRALISNLESKCEGKTRAQTDNGGKINQQSSLNELCKTFPFIKTRKIVEYLRDALDDQALSERTPLQYFLSPKWLIPL